MAFDSRSALPPVAKKIPVSATHHGIATIDEYHWLRAANWQEVMRDPQKLGADIRAHLEAENAYQAAMMAGTEKLQSELAGEMKGRIKQDDSSVPMRDGPFAYGTRFVTGGEHPRVFRTVGDGGAETVLLDGDKEAAGHTFFRLGGSDHSPDHRILAWSCDDAGSELYTVRFRDCATGVDANDIVRDSAGGVFTKDSAGYLYTRVDENHRPSKLFLHRIGAAPSADRLIHEETDPGKFLGAGKTQSGDFIVISSHDHDTTQAWLIPADQPLASPVLIAARNPGIEYSVDEGLGTLYILTNHGGARDFKIVTAPAASPQPEHWRDLVGHVPGRLILDHAIYKQHLVRLERENGLPRIVIRRLADGGEHTISFDEEAYSLGLIGSLEFDTGVIRFTYSSMTTPSRVYDYNLETRERTLLKEQEVPSGHDPKNYVTRRIFAPAGDGEIVPVTLLYARNTPLDGTAPCLLYGYGSYGISVPAAFDTNILSLADRGFVYAIAHVRGGKDKGYAWYEAGRLANKANTFSDFIAAAEHLVRERFASKGRIVALGRSAGGMLMGAIANIRPELFGGIVAEVPFVDVLNTMLDASLPLTPPEWGEWGNPAASRKDYDAIRAYSPYENIKAQAYPPILAVAGLTDSRLTYWEPAKWVARLRAAKTGDAPVLLKTHMGAGHAGTPGRFSKLAEFAFSYAFAIKCVS